MHTPVLKKEILEYLNPEPNQNFIDATLGEAGHTLSILEKVKPNGKVLGLELDPQLYSRLLPLHIDRLIVVNDSYINLKKVIKKAKIKSFSGILFDLGFSSWHVEESKKGFSFLRNEVLDMRYNKKASTLTAKDIVNEWPEQKLKEILKEYGEERFSGRISRHIVENRKKKRIQKTFDLVEIIWKAIPSRYRYQRLHFATRTFQALRIATNDELNGIKKALPQALSVIEKGGKILVISFHSLEDRIIKNYFREESKKGLIKILTKKPIRPSQEEIIRNPRARSSKLRVAEKI
jgi:16S rRNA (cytosine1402-N4)-methyltransferase